MEFGGGLHCRSPISVYLMQRTQFSGHQGFLHGSALYHITATCLLANNLRFLTYTTVHYRGNMHVSACLSKQGATSP